MDSFPHNLEGLNWDPQSNNQASLQNAFQQQGANSLLQQSMQQQFGQQSNNMMQQMMEQMGGSQSQQQQFGSNSFPQGSSTGMSGTTSSLLDRLGQGLSSQFSDPQQQPTAASLLGGNTGSFGNDLLSGLSQQQLGMANDILQRRLSLGLGGNSNGGGMNNNSSFQQQLNNMSAGGGPGGTGGWGGNGSSGNMFAGLDQFGGTETSNLEGLMASQLQQQQQQQQQQPLQQQLTLQQQLMLAAQQQGERRGSFGAGGGMDASFGLQLSMMGQQPPQASMSGGLDMSSPQHQQLMQLQQQQHLQQHEPQADLSGDHEEPDLGGKTRAVVSSGGDEGKKARKKKAKTFPEKLMQAITSHGEEEAVAWLPDGKSFVIVNDDMFVDEVLNKVFKESKYTSFVRKLHRWGFVRLTSGTGTDCFHHPLFQRGRRDLASKITCTPRDKDGNLKTPHRNMKPPSLAGVERFIRQKADAAVAMAEAKARHRDSDPGDSVPLRSTSGLPPQPPQQQGVPSQLVLEGMDKAPEHLGMGGSSLTADASGGGDMSKEMVKSMGLDGVEDGHHVANI